MFNHIILRRIFYCQPNIRYNRIKTYLLPESSPSIFSVDAVSFFHRQVSNNFSSFSKNHGKKRINSEYFNTKQCNILNNEKKQYVFYGAIVLSSIFAFYIYECLNNRTRLFEQAKLWSREDENNLNSIQCDSDSEESSRNKKNQRPGRKYSSMNFFADIVEQASPSVAFIQAQGHHPFLPMAMNISSGSGFLVDKQDGIILTNAHVIANCQQVLVKFNDGRTMDGAVEFVDERLDLATVRVPLVHIKDLEPVPLGDSKHTRAGEWVIAVGAPFSLSNTVTVGVISSISRAGRDLGVRDNIEYIQTDASINVGNSGGPLLNLDGEAIGINTLKVGEGISFAIPAYYADEFLKKCKNFRHQEMKHKNNLWPLNRGRNDIDSRYSGESNNAPMPNRRVYLGFTIVTLTPHLIESHRYRDPNFPLDVQGGVMIYRIVLGAPAHLSGLESGDIIIAINGKEIRNADEVYRIIQSDQNYKTDLEFLVKRGRQDLKLKVRPQVATE